MYVSADGFSSEDAGEVAVFIHIEDIDRQAILLAHRGSGEVHHLESSAVNLVIGDVVKLAGAGVLLRIGGVDAVDACTLKHHVGLDLDAAQGRTGVRRKIRAARATGADDNVALVKVLDGAPLIVKLADGLHADGREHVGLDAEGSESAGEGEAINHCGAHAHLVSLNAVKALADAAEPAKNVASTDDDSNLYAGIVGFLNLDGIVVEPVDVDAIPLLAHQALAAELEQYTIKLIHSQIDR